MDNRIKVGDRVRTPDGRTITVQGVLYMSAPTYKVSECQPVEGHKDEETTGTTVADQGTAAGVGASTKAAASATGDGIMWGT
jgi:hypothetical protein